LLAPGAIWLALFFVIPFYSLLSASLFGPNGSVLTGYKVTSTSATTVGDPGLPLRVVPCPLVRRPGDIDLPGDRYVLAYAIAFKAGRWRNLLLVLVIAPFLHQLPASDVVLEVDPLRSRLRGLDASEPAHSRPVTGGC